MGTPEDVSKKPIIRWESPLKNSTDGPFGQTEASSKVLIVLYFFDFWNPLWELTRKHRELGRGCALGPAIASETWLLSSAYWVGLAIKRRGGDMPLDGVRSEKR